MAESAYLQSLRCLCLILATPKCILESRWGCERIFRSLVDHIWKSLFLEGSYLKTFNFLALNSRVSLQLFDLLCCFLIDQGSLCQVGGCAFHHQRQPLLSSSAGVQCGRCRGCAVLVMQGRKNWVVPDGKKLGPKLAIQWQCNGRSSFVFHDHHQWWQNSCLTGCCSFKLAIRTNFWRLTVLVRAKASHSWSWKSAFWVSFICSR